MNPLFLSNRFAPAVIPAHAGIQGIWFWLYRFYLVVFMVIRRCCLPRRLWIPAFAGMTSKIARTVGTGPRACPMPCSTKDNHRGQDNPFRLSLQTAGSIRRIAKTRVFSTVPQVLPPAVQADTFFLQSARPFERGNPAECGRKTSAPGCERRYRTPARP